MERREFIKNGLCLGCMGILVSGCNNIFQANNGLKNDRFYYKSENDLPKTVRLEACSLCQLNCPECTTRKLEKQAPKDWLGYLKFKDFKKFVDENDFIKEIELSNNGEIFLNPELDEIIKYAYEKGIWLRAGNGVNLNTVSETTLENLVKYKFKRMTVSLDAATSETYKIYRRGGDFNKVIDNIKKINYFKKKYNSEFPVLHYQFILFGHNEHEIELAKKKAKELNMRMRFRRNNSIEYSPIKNKELVEKQTGLKIYDEKNKMIEKLFSIKKGRLYACYTLFYSPQIDYNGDLLGCCQIFLENLGINVFKEGLLNALNSQNVIYTKHMLTDLSIPVKQNLPCAKCSKYRFLKRRGKGLQV